jgi:hypothetical protein
MSEVPQFICGPYHSPPVKIGEYISCEIRGLQRVKTFTDALIPQPIKTGQGCAIIVYGDLVAALRVESEVAIAYWWGVSTQAVRRWRRALRIGRVTQGTRSLLVENGRDDIGALAHAGARASLAPESRQRRDQHHAGTMRAKGLPHAAELGRRGGQKNIQTATRDELGRFEKN